MDLRAFEPNRQHRSVTEGEGGREREREREREKER